VSASPITRAACRVNLSSICASVSGTSRLPIARSTRLVIVVPSSKAISISTEASCIVGEAVASTRSRRATMSGAVTTSSVKAVGAPSPRRSAQAAAWKTENLPSSPVRGVRLPVSSSTSGWVVSRTPRIALTRSPISSRICRQPSIVGWMTMPQANGL
jgi:hypothetical protein